MSVKRNRFVRLTGATKSVNRDLEAKPRALADWKGYTTNLAGESADFVFAALTVGHWIETRTGWIKRFVATARRHRTVQIRIGPQTITTADPLPDDLRAAVATITDSNVHQLVASRVR